MFKKSWKVPKNKKIPAVLTAGIDEGAVAAVRSVNRLS